MPVTDNLGTRMKEFYEAIPKTKLMRRTPVAIRLDGKAFHTFTKGFKKPFDEILIQTMQDTMKYLCSHIQGCVLGYTQSDEITLILVDYQTLETDAWFDYEVQKMCSVSASMATMAFNKYFSANITLKQDKCDNEYLWALRKAEMCGAMFDARVFNIPKEEVTNLIYWRQLDAARNSIQMVGQANFSQKQLHKKSCSMIQEMLHEEKGINWNDFPTHQKRGSCCIRTQVDSKSTWVVDLEIPMFSGKNREYIERLIHYED
jgi:tRNA(His) 5'-end guanylyltransferase